MKYALKPLLVLTVILALMLLACGPGAAPMPTPDVPRFAEGEAIAAVKDWIGQKAYIRSGQTQLSCLFVLKHRTPQYFDMTWSEDYLGKGVWSVTLVAGNLSFQSEITEKYDVVVKLLGESITAELILLNFGGRWQVYEYTGNVVSIQRSYVDVNCG